MAVRFAHLSSVRRPAVCRSALASLGAILALTACVNPEKTAKRGAEELARHRDDPLLVSPIPGLRLISSSDSAASAIENDPIFPSSFPTTFTRTFEMAGFTPEQLFAAYQEHLERSSLALVSVNCRVSDRNESRVWSGPSRGDDVRATVSVSPMTRQLGFTLGVSKRSGNQPSVNKRSVEKNSVGLRNCLTVDLPAPAYSPRYSTPRTTDELCRVVVTALVGATPTSAAESGAGTCTLRLPRDSSAEVRIFVEDLRTSSLVQLLDGAPPETKPSAAFFRTSTPAWCSITLMTLAEGALRLSANNETVCREFGDSVVAKR